jgi:hypothetical protein
MCVVLDAACDRTSEQIATAIERLLDHEDPALQDSDVVTPSPEMLW